MKDAKGHGSDARGAHSGGVQDIGHPVYNTAQKVRGYTNARTPLNADYNSAGGMLRQRMGDMSKEDHKAAGDAHIASAMQMDAQHRNLVSSAMGKLGMESPGPLISGIVSTKFSDSDKDQLRSLAHGASDHRSAAFAHYAASGMRLPTARARYQGLKG